MLYLLKDLKRWQHYIYHSITASGVITTSFFHPHIITVIFYHPIGNTTKFLPLLQQLLR